VYHGIILILVAIIAMLDMSRYYRYTRSYYSNVRYVTVLSLFKMHKNERIVKGGGELFIFDAWHMSVLPK